MTVAFVLAVLWPVAAWIALDRVTHPPRYPDAGLTPAAHGLRFEEISFPSLDGTTLSGWFIPLSADSIPKEPIVLVHGIGADRTDLHWLIPFLARNGRPIFAFDLRAHGKSGGTESSLGLREADDVLAAARWLSRRQGGSRVGILAVSMGGAAACEAAARDTTIFALALDSPFDDLVAISRYRAMRDFGWMGLVVRPLFPLAYRARFGVWPHAFSPARSLAAHPIPVLVMSGEADDHIPPTHHKRLYEAASGPKRFLSFPGAFHCGLHGADAPRYEREVLAFFAAPEAVGTATTDTGTPAASAPPAIVAR